MEKVSSTDDKKNTDKSTDFIPALKTLFEFVMLKTPHLVPSALTEVRQKADFCLTCFNASRECQACPWPNCLAQCQRECKCPDAGVGYGDLDEYDEDLETGPSECCWPNHQTVHGAQRCKGKCGKIHYCTLCNRPRFVCQIEEDCPFWKDYIDVKRSEKQEKYSRAASKEFGAKKHRKQRKQQRQQQQQYFTKKGDDWFTQIGNFKLISR